MSGEWWCLAPEFPRSGPHRRPPTTAFGKDAYFSILASAAGSWVAHQTSVVVSSKAARGLETVPIMAMDSRSEKMITRMALAKRREGEHREDQGQTKLRTSFGVSCGRHCSSAGV